MGILKESNRDANTSRALLGLANKIGVSGFFIWAISADRVGIESTRWLEASKTKANLVTDSEPIINRRATESAGIRVLAVILLEAILVVVSVVGIGPLVVDIGVAVLVVAVVPVVASEVVVVEAVVAVVVVGASVAVLLEVASAVDVVAVVIVGAVSSVFEVNLVVVVV